MPHKDPVVRAAYLKKYWNEHRGRRREIVKQSDDKHRAKRRAAAREYRKKNTTKVYKKNRTWAQANPIRLAELNYRSRVRNLYKLTIAQVNAMVDAQHNRCAICQEVMTMGGKRTGASRTIDHNHVTGKVRELLCVRCNSLLGMARENLTILASASSYLLKHGEMCR